MRELYPEIEPYVHGLLDVGDGQSIYWEECGNPAGKPVVSTPIQDVVRPYGELGLVEIAADAETFSQAIKTCLLRDDPNWLSAVDRFLDGMSWDHTFQLMWTQMQIIMQQKRVSATPISTSERSEPYV